MLMRRLAAAWLTVMVSGGGVAHAQIQSELRDTTPFIIHDRVTTGPEVGVDAVAAPGEPLLVQSATSIRAARLSADTPSLAGFRKTKVFTAGTAMFGVYSDTGWAYCAVAETSAAWWAGDEFVCYEDLDADGRFESAMLSGAPFMGVPLFVFELGFRQTLPEPAPYTIAAGTEGPPVDVVLMPRVQRRTPPGQSSGAPLTIVTVAGGFRKGSGTPPTLVPGWTDAAPIKAGETARLEVMGAEIEILEVGDDGSVRYRILSPIPTQVKRVAMGLTRTTTYTPIFIPG